MRKNQYKLPLSILSNIQRALKCVGNRKVEWLKETLSSDLYILSPFFYQNINGERKYCIMSILAEINNDSFNGKSDLERVRAAHNFATKIRIKCYEDKSNNDEAMFFETYFMDRYLKDKENFITENETREIMSLCSNILKNN